jgi:hypothetical protein
MLPCSVYIYAFASQYSSSEKFADSVDRQTHFSVRSVHLLGSWDNFATPYAMERDTRRVRGQWRGCHSFREDPHLTRTGADVRKDGGLRMGQTYYYYVCALLLVEERHCANWAISMSWTEPPRCTTRRCHLPLTVRTYQDRLSTHCGFRLSEV